MGGASAGGNGNGNNNKTKFGYTKPKTKTKKAVDFIKSGGIIGSVIKGFKKGAKKSKQNVMDYEGQAAGKTPMRNPFPKEREGGDGGNNNTPTPKVKVPEIPKVNTSPTTVEVDQSSATDTTIVEEPKKENDIYTRNKKSKARGRSMMTLTSAQGVKDNKLTLGKRSLLGS